MLVSYMYNTYIYICIYIYIYMISSSHCPRSNEASAGGLQKGCLSSDEGSGRLSVRSLRPEGSTYVCMCVCIYV